MSIALLIANPDGHQVNRYLPIATESDFKEYWLPGCVALNLTRVASFSMGFTLRPDDVSEINGELLRLDLWAKDSLDPPIYRKIHNRIQLLSKSLRNLQRRPGIEASIG